MAFAAASNLAPASAWAASPPLGFLAASRDAASAFAPSLPDVVDAERAAPRAFEDPLAPAAFEPLPPLDAFFFDPLAPFGLTTGIVAVMSGSYAESAASPEAPCESAIRSTSFLCSPSEFPPPGAADLSVASMFSFS